jgi:hypothetical protein
MMRCKVLTFVLAMESPVAASATKSVRFGMSLTTESDFQQFPMAQNSRKATDPNEDVPFVCRN